MRWVCPTCGGVKLAPSKPRRDDVRRYCLKCSESSGRLVARTCPSADSKRAKRESVRKKKGEKRRAKETASEVAKWTVDGVDVRLELRRLWKLAKKFFPLGAIPTLVVRRSASKKYTRGQMWHYGRIVATIGTDTDRAEVAEFLAHEVAHFACGPGEGHSAKFHARLGTIIEHAYEVPMAPAYRRAETAWGRDQRLEQAIRESPWFLRTAR